MQKRRVTKNILISEKSKAIKRLRKDKMAKRYYPSAYKHAKSSESTKDPQFNTELQIFASKEAIPDKQSWESDALHTFMVIGISTFKLLIFR